MALRLDRAIVYVLFRLILAVGVPGLSFLIFKSQFWGDVMCDNPQVATLIYNGSQVSSISNVQEIAFDTSKKLRTCGAVATVQSHEHRMIFMIDTSGRGVQDPVSGTTRKFAVSYKLTD